MPRNILRSRLHWQRHCQSRGAEVGLRSTLPEPGSGLRVALIAPHWRWCWQRCGATSDLAPCGREDHVGGAACRLSKKRTYAISAGERSTAGQSVLWRRLYLPLETIGPREAFGVGRQRHGFGDEVARGRSLHLAADPRRRRIFDGDTIGDADQRPGLDARDSKSCEATGCNDVRSGHFAGESDESQVCIVDGASPRRSSFRYCLSHRDGALT